MSVVKEFYRIVTIIVEAHNQYKEKQDLQIGQGVPEFSIGVPLYEAPKSGKEVKDESMNLSFKDAKFEVEIQLQNENKNNQND